MGVFQGIHDLRFKGTSEMFSTEQTLYINVSPLSFSCCREKLLLWRFPKLVADGWESWSQGKPLHEP